MARIAMTAEEKREAKRLLNKEQSYMRTLWDKKNTTLVSCKFHNVKDSEIVEHLSKFEKKSTEIKRLAKVGLDYEKSGDNKSDNKNC